MMIALSFLLYFQSTGYSSYLYVYKKRWGKKKSRPFREKIITKYNILFNRGRTTQLKESKKSRSIFQENKQTKNRLLQIYIYD